MKLLEFYKNYPDEESCKLAFKKYREQEGVICKKCGNKTHYWKKNREQWECKKCAHRTTLKSGTVMHGSKLPFQYWFIAMHLITSTKKTFSAKELQRQLGHKRYEPIWAMLHKLRIVMGRRDEEYMLNDEVELDEGFFETVSITRDKKEPLKRGKGSQKQTTVLVATESKPVEDSEKSKKYNKKKQVRFIKMQTIYSYKKDDMEVAVTDIIEKGSNIISDDSNSYNNLKNNYKHEGQVIPKNKINEILPWVHTAISNAKRLFLDVHHRIDDDFLQSYLNEFCFKFNRRYFDNLFERLLITAVSYRWNWLGEKYG